VRHVNLILQEAVPRLGEAGDLVKVKVGFARNFLVPQGKAIAATKANVKELEHQKRVISGKVAKELNDLGAVKHRLNKVRLEVEAKVGDSGKLFGSVTAAQIGELLKAQGIEIDRRKIALSEPIKEVGEHKVSIRLHRDVIAEILVVVSPTE